MPASSLVVEVWCGQSLKPTFSNLNCPGWEGLVLQGASSVQHFSLFNETLEEEQERGSCRNCLLLGIKRIRSNIKLRCV